MKKLIICAALAMCSFGVLNSFATDAHAYTDVDGHWAEDAITRWSEYDVMKGNNNTFNPDSAITRADFAVIIDSIMGYNETTYNFFSDLENEYYTDAVLKLFNAGIMSNKGSSIYPNLLVTREDACVMVAKALHFNPTISDSQVFADDSSISPSAINYVHTLYEKGIISADTLGNFNPTQNITRAELAAILDLGIALFANEATIYTEDVLGTVVIHSQNASLNNISITGDLIIAENVGDGDVFLNNVTILGSVTIKGGGENSIYFNNVTVDGETTINKEGSRVRLVTTGSTTLPTVTISSDATLKTTDLNSSGAVASVEVEYARNVSLEGSFGEITSSIPAVSMEIDGTFDELTLEQDATINGKDFSSGSNVTVKDITTTTTTTKPSTSTGGSTTTTPTTPEVDNSLPDGHYALNVVQPANGSVSLSANSASAATKVSITVTPADGYVLDYITYTYNGATVKTNNKSFYMPSYDVTVSAVYKLA